MTKNTSEINLENREHQSPQQHAKRSLEEIKKVARGNLFSMPEMPETIRRKKAAEKNIAFVQEAVQKVKVIFPLKDGKFDPDCVPVKAEQDSEYLGEAYDGWQRTAGEKASIMSPAMTTQEREERKVSFGEDGIIRRNDGSVVSTLDIENKGLQNCQAFVLDKADNLYLFNLEGEGRKRNGEDVYTFHGSVLGNKPASSAGLMSVVDGKVKLILDRSGHYKPDKLDMYRGVKALTERGVLHEDCNVCIGDEVINHKQLVQEMEQRGDGIPLWQKLTNERAEEHEAMLKGSRLGMNMRAALEAPKPTQPVVANAAEPFLKVKRDVQGRRAPKLKFNSGERGM